jgi:hypothetical protein
MPQIQLVYLRSAPQKVGPEVIYYERIKALLDIGKSGNVRHDCLVDIGAVLCSRTNPRSATCSGIGARRMFARALGLPPSSAR